MSRLTLTVCALALPALLAAQGAPRVDWPTVETETLTHFQTLLRMDTSDPPGNERPAADYLKQVLDREGIATELFEAEPNRSTLSPASRATAGSGRCC